MDLSNNQLTKIEGLNTLTQMNRLSLSNNQLPKIEGLETLTQLNSLELSSNQLTKIEGLEQFVTLLDHIKEINITDNPFDAEPWINAEILKQVGKDVVQIKSMIKNHLDKKVNTAYYDLPLKIILLGNSQAGKSTTALSLLAKGENPVSVDREKSTHGLLIKNLQDDKSTKAIIYDFGGQDYYHNTYGMFFSTASLFVVLWTESLDKNTKSKDTDIESHHFNQKYWLGNIKYYFEKNDHWIYSTEGLRPSSITQPVYLVQNLFGEDRVSYKLGKDEIKDFGIQKQFHVSYPLLDEKDSELFKLERQSLFHSIDAWIHNNKKIQQKGFTKKHLKIFNAVIEQHEENKENGVPISVKEFFKTFGLTADDQWFLGILHDRGTIYYLHDKEKIWLNPEGVSFTIHAQLSKQRVNEKEGKFKIDDLKELFSEDLIDLMKESGILHWDEYDSLYIIPQYLALKPDNDPLHDLATMDIDNGFFIHFKDYVPHGLMPRLICRFGSNPGKKYYYRDRIIFSMPIDNKVHFARIQISLDLVQLQLSVQFSLPKDKEYMRKELMYGILITKSNCIMQPNPMKIPQIAIHHMSL